MLVLSNKRDEFDDGSSVLHVLRRYVERSGQHELSLTRSADVSPTLTVRLLKVIEDINAAMPADWRMTRTKDNFRIRVKDDDRLYTLVGQTFRLSDDRTMHVVMSVHRVHWTDNQDIQAIFDRHDKRYLNRRDLREFRESLQKEHPEISRPNLYFFRPPLDDQAAFLYARQYERCFRRDLSVEYHRVHALTPGGIDMKRYRWLKWDVYGNVEEVPAPPSNSRGETYWMTTPKEDAKAKELLDNYANILAEHGMQPSPARLAEGLTSREHKLDFEGPFSGATQLFESAKALMQEAGYGIESVSEHSHCDFYFDASDLPLFVNDTPFRLRRDGLTAIVTLKPQRAQNKDLYETAPEVATVSAVEADKMLQGTSRTYPRTSCSSAYFLASDRSRSR